MVVVTVAIIGRWLDHMYSSDPSWKLKFCGSSSKVDKSWLLFCTQVIS
jgi:hypothetical protein